MTPLLQRNITDMSKSRTVIDQNALDYTRRWSPDQTPEFLSLRDEGPKVRYLRAGQGPVLVLLQSIRTQLDLFQRVIPRLTDHFAVYAFDFPGFGWSEIIPGADYREPAMRAHVVDFIERLDLRDVTLVGELMGATLALTTAAVLGHRVKRVIAFNPYDYLPGVEPPDFIDELVKGGKRPGYSNVACAVYRGLPTYVAARSYYARIDVPVTLVYADHDWSRPAEREANLARIKRGRMLVLKDASHIASLERPEEFARILIETQSTARSAA